MICVFDGEKYRLSLPQKQSKVASVSPEWLNASLQGKAYATKKSHFVRTQSDVNQSVLFDYKRGDGERSELDFELFVLEWSRGNVLIPVFPGVHGAACTDDLCGVGGDLRKCGEIECHRAFVCIAVDSDNHDLSGFAIPCGERGWR